MIERLNDKQSEAVSALPLEARYEHFIKQVSDSEVIWSLGANDGWALMGDDEGHEVIPVWPDERYAAACLSGEWMGNEPRSISLSDWMDKWLPGMTKDNRLVVVSSTPNSNGAVVTPERLLEDLRDCVETNTGSPQPPIMGESEPKT